MKKFALWTLIVMLVAGCVGAQASAMSFTVPLYDRTENGVDFIGTAVSAGEGYYVSGGLSGVNFTQPFLLTEDGPQYVTHLQLFTNGIAVLTTGSQQAGVPVSAEKPAGGVRLVSYHEEGVATRTAQVLYPIRWRNADCYLIQAVEALSTGSAAFDAEQKLTGLVVAEWGEGVYRYVLLPVSSFGSAGGEVFGIKPEDGAPTEEKQVEITSTQWLQPSECKVEGHLMTVSWTQEMLQNVQEDSMVTLFIADEGNSYYSWSYGKASSGKLVMPVMPGRSYSYALQHTHGQPEPSTEWFQLAQHVDIPVLPAFDKHDYQDVSIFFGTLPKTADGISVTPAEEVKVTRQVLEDASVSLFLQVTSTYDVTEESSCDMLVILATPDGSVFLEPAGYTFMPELAQGDVWNTNLDGLLAEYLQIKGSYAPGRYTVQYYFDGALVNSVSFTIE